MHYKVWTVTHPDDISEHKNLYDAYCAMMELVEDGFEPLCQAIYGESKIFTYSEVHETIHA